MTGCGVGDEDIDVVVVSGTELAPSQGSETEPVAYVLAGGDAVQFISAPLYSGSCPPEADAQQDGATLTLSIDADEEDACTADGAPYTFVMSADSEEAPTQLVVEESGQDDIRLDLEPLPSSR